MGARMVTAMRTARTTLDIPAMVGGQWYPVARYVGQNNRSQQAAARFVISDGTPSRSTYLSLVAAVPPNGSQATLHLETYAADAAPPHAVTAVRVVMGDQSTARLDVLAGGPVSQALRMRVEHFDYHPGQIWRVPESVSATPAVPAGGAAVVRRGVGPTGTWVAASLVNGWANFGDVYQNGSYRMLPGSLVELRGLIRSGTQDHFIPMFVLPPGFRPGRRIICDGIGGTNGTSRIDIAPDGAVSNPFGNNNYLSLDGCRFTAEL